MNNRPRPCIICGASHTRGTSSKYCYPCYNAIQAEMKKVGFRISVGEAIERLSIKKKNEIAR
jgi:hypothetical protein